MYHERKKYFDEQLIIALPLRIVRLTKVAFKIEKKNFPQLINWWNLNTFIWYSCNFSLIAPKIAINSKANDTYCNDDHYYCSIYEVGFLLKNNGKGIYLSVALTFYIFLWIYGTSLCTYTDGVLWPLQLCFWSNY